MIRVAMVEDDLDLANLLTEYLQQFSIEVDSFEDPFIALSAIGLKEYDLIILDLSLPGMDGLEVCKELVDKYEIPIIISSARSDIADKVTALQLGADDYLPKPYDPRELEVRIKALLRRTNKGSPQDSGKESSGGIFVYDPRKKIITKNGSELQLTAAEFELLSLLISRKGFVVSREEILNECELLHSDDEKSSSIAVIISRIRSKIEANSKRPQYLVTVRGVGYKLKEE
ncbi:MAG: response regulator transcription factor [Campylobacterota bacterium]